MSEGPPIIYICHEPDDRALAERLDAWPRSNPDFETYAARMAVDVGSVAADPLKAQLGAQIAAADVTVCIISQATFADPWIAWEIEASIAGPKRNGLVGILLHEGDQRPPGMVGRGAVFVPFRRAKIEEAIAFVIMDKPTTDDFEMLDE